MGPYLAPNTKGFVAADLLKEAQEFHTLRLEQERENFEAMADDLRMVGGDQWDRQARAEREAYSLPCYQGNQFTTYIQQITGEIRRNKPAIHCVRADGAATADVAEVMEGIIRNAERASDATSVYAAVAKSVSACGIGHARLHHTFVGDWDAELRISYIEDPFSVLWDENAKRLDKGDAKRCLVVTELSKKDFEKQYPKHSSATWAQERPFAQDAKWSCGSDNKVTLAEYWVIKETPIKLTRVIHNQHWLDQWGRFQPPTGQEQTLTNLSDEERAELSQTGFSIVQEREDVDREVCMYLLGGNAVIAHSVWPGERIPIFTCVGEQIDRGDKIITHGLVRWVKDAQKAFNLARSIDLQLLGMTPKSPFILDLETIKGSENIWNTAHRIAYPYLPYNSQGGQRAKPERVDPISQNPGPQAAASVAHDDMQAGMGIFNASIGQRSNETSGKAIDARDAQADTGTFVYIDNLAKMISAIGQEAVNVIPIIYSTQKMLAIVGPDDSQGIVDIEAMKAAGSGLDIGKYLVFCKVGPAYQTRREKSVDRLVSMGQFAPDYAQPILFKHIVLNDEMPNADEFVRELEEARAAAMAPPPIPGMPPPGAPMPPGAPPPEQMMPPPEAVAAPMPGRAPPLADLNVFPPPGLFPASGPVVAPLEAGPPGMGAY